MPAPATITIRWRPAGVASSPSAMFVRCRSSASPPRSAKAPRWWPRCTLIWPRPRASRLRRPTLRRQLEVLELKTRRHDTADQCPVAEALRRLPGMSRHDGLRAFPGGEIAAERDALDAPLAL